MTITKIDMFRDGGTIELLTDQGMFCIDNRMRSTTKGHIYLGYPKDDNSNYIPCQSLVREQIIQALMTDEIDGQDRLRVITAMGLAGKEGEQG